MGRADRGGRAGATVGPNIAEPQGLAAPHRPEPAAWRDCGDRSAAIPIGPRLRAPGGTPRYLPASLSRAPLVLKAETAFLRRAEIHYTTIGWRLVNPVIKAR
jgi:hypothetical protein